jgi:hypothetical protein
MPEKPEDASQGNGRTERERALDRAIKDTFPASDPIAPAGGIATPKDDRRTLPARGEPEKDPDGKN